MALHINQRLKELASPHCDLALLKPLYGLETSYFKQAVAPIMDAWAQRLGGAYRPSPAGKFNRHLLERYLVHHQLVTTQDAAINFAMSAADLMHTLEALRSGRMLVPPFDAFVSLPIMPEMLVRKLPQLIPSLSNFIFDSMDSMARELQFAIEEELGFKVTPIYCATSKALGHSPPLLASSYDALTDEPVNIRHEVMLDMRKPLAVKPDICSWMTFARNTARLKGVLLGGGVPPIPTTSLALLRTAT